MSETESTTTRKRSSAKAAPAEEEAAVVESYDEALEKGYIGGPADETDYTVAGVLAAEEASD